MNTIEKTLSYLKRFTAVISLISIVLYALLELDILSLNPNPQIYRAVIIIALIPLTADIIFSLIKKRIGVDIIALASISGSLLLEEYLAGIIIVLMLSGGEVLEDYALKRSRRELKSLIDKTPRIANLIKGTNIIKVNVEEIKPGNKLLVKKGEVIPVDALIKKGSSQIDESSITGEPVGNTKKPGERVYSGSINMGEPVELEALKTSEESQYQIIVELVKQAEKGKPPFVRLADRYSVWFTLIAFGIAGLAYFATGDPTRALTVLVVATPCPLILATPIAFASGISKAAELGIVFKSGEALEKAAKANSILFDKTGTLTDGKPKLTKILISDKLPRDIKNTTSQKSILKIASAIEQYSQHPIGDALIQEAFSKGIQVPEAKNIKEEVGFGISGEVNGELYHIGGKKYIRSKGIKISSTLEDKSKYFVFVCNKNTLLAQIVLEDQPKENAVNVMEKIRTLKFKKIMLLTGDKYDSAYKIAETFGIKNFKYNFLPQDKLAEVEKIQSAGYRVAFVGDGVNDAPALAKADVGIAIGALSKSASTEAGSVVITKPEFEKVYYTFSISKRVLKISKQGIFLGMGLSIILMFGGAWGLFLPAAGAILQEVVDISVIINALRARDIKTVA